jgi:hypothetical protein
MQVTSAQSEQRIRQRSSEQRDVQWIRARIYARGEAAYGKLLDLPTLFANLLDAMISCFAKLSRMATSFGKLLEMLLDTTSAEAGWLRELLMDLLVVEKPILAISMNCDNQTVIIQVNSSRDNLKSTRHVKR